MSKGIELTQSQIKAYESGATMFLFPIKFNDSGSYSKLDFYATLSNNPSATDCENYGMGRGCDCDCPVLNRGECELQFNENSNLLIEILSPIQKGDKNIFVQEEFVKCKQCGCIMYNFNYYEDSNCPKCNEDFITEKAFYSSNQMTKEQSRYSFSECIDVRVVRVQDIPFKDYPKLGFILLKLSFEEFYNQQLKEQNINRTYKDNDYVFLPEFKR